ncbi:MAG: CHAT domain-containing protein [Cyanobacteriota bacterium]|nr:CHAT domain-containing protein [Cyanobacteriota bacterium]
MLNSRWNLIRFLRVFPNKKKQRQWTNLLSLFALSLLLVTATVPAIARSPESPPTALQAPVEQSDRVAQQNPLQAGRQFYQSGQYAEAVNLWQQAEQSYSTSPLNRIQALNYLSLAYQKLGQWSQGSEAIARSLNLLETVAGSEPRRTVLLAQALNVQGHLHLATGQTEAALQTWTEAESTYERAGDIRGKLGSQIDQAQALQALGQYRRAQTLLKRLVANLQLQPDSLLKADGLRSLGNALSTIGDFEEAKLLLEESWAISQDLEAEGDTAQTLLSIGNIARELNQDDAAKAYYRQAAQQAKTAIGRVQARLNFLSLLVHIQEGSEAKTAIPNLIADLSVLAPSRSAIYAWVNLAENAIKLEEQNSSSEHLETIASGLATGVQQAQQLGDRRAEAYALYQLGKLYETTQQTQEAADLTQQALSIAQEIDAADLIARTAAQLGSLLRQQGELDGAIAAYRTAYHNLQSLRSDLVAIDTNVQFTFKESVEPIYRELVSLLLTPPTIPPSIPPSVPPSTKGDEGGSQENLKQAREVIEALQLAELDNFFRDACLDVKSAQIDEIDTQAAVIYPIILRDRLETIVALPGQPLRHHAIPASSEQVETLVRRIRSSLYIGFSKSERLKRSQQLYNWLLGPVEDELERSGISTIVFVLDGALRNVPIAALYDGQQYAIEKYSIALSSGLQLFPQGLQKQELNALTAGLTEGRQGFSPLPAVKEEVEDIATEVNSSVLLDRQFTRQAFQEKVDSSSFRVVHLATHGQFSSNPEETFLLTWDGRLDIQDFDRVFQKRRVGILQPIELLVLSACQTASGDNRAVLGLAGLALRSGAYSTIASLWSVNDESTAELMSEFYRQLARGDRELAKAEALRQAQLSLLHNPLYNHPYFWSAFVLVGNWL